MTNFEKYKDEILPRVEQAEELDMLIEALIIARREIALLYSFN